MNDMLIRVGWVFVVLAGGVALARGLLLTTYILLVGLVGAMASGRRIS